MVSSTTISSARAPESLTSLLAFRFSLLSRLVEVCTWFGGDGFVKVRAGRLAPAENGFEEACALERMRSNKLGSSVDSTMNGNWIEWYGTARKQKTLEHNGERWQLKKIKSKYRAVSRAAIRPPLTRLSLTHFRTARTGKGQRMTRHDSWLGARES